MAERDDLDLAGEEELAALFGDTAEELDPETQERLGQALARAGSWERPVREAMDATAVPLDDLAARRLLEAARATGQHREWRWGAAAALAASLALWLAWPTPAVAPLQGATDQRVAAQGPAQELAQVAPVALQPAEVASAEEGAWGPTLDDREWAAADDGLAPQAPDWGDDLLVVEGALGLDALHGLDGGEEGLGPQALALP